MERRAQHPHGEEKLTKSRVPKSYRPPASLPGLLPNLRNEAFKDAPDEGAAHNGGGSAPGPCFRVAVSPQLCRGRPLRSGHSARRAPRSLAEPASTSNPAAACRSRTPAFRPPTTASSGDAGDAKPQGPGAPRAEASCGPRAAACPPHSAPGVVVPTSTPQPAESRAAWWGAEGRGVESKGEGVAGRQSM